MPSRHGKAAAAAAAFVLVATGCSSNEPSASESAFRTTTSSLVTSPTQSAGEAPTSSPAPSQVGQGGATGQPAGEPGGSQARGGAPLPAGALPKEGERLHASGTTADGWAWRFFVSVKDDQPCERVEVTNESASFGGGGCEWSLPLEVSEFFTTGVQVMDGVVDLRVREIVITSRTGQRVIAKPFDVNPFHGRAYFVAFLPTPFHTKSIVARDEQGQVVAEQGPPPGEAEALKMFD